MCGLAGFTGPGADAPAIVRAMIAALAHRGPDGSGDYVDADIAFGHNRLAVIDLAGGAQPRVEAATGDALIFNGEIYGYRDLAADLRAGGVALRDRSDTEVLFQMLRRFGIRATLAKIDGMFAFAFRDGRSGTLYLARDRFGEKPLFYGLAGGHLVFGSELSALRRHPAFRASGIDREAAFQFLTYEYLPGDRSGREGISKLPPGHLLTFANGRIEVAPYWQPPRGENAAIVDEAEGIARLEQLLDASVRERLVADVPVGVFLSGGVDSGLIAALAARHASAITAFTVRMPVLSFDETPHAVKVASHLGIRHEIVELGRADLLDAFAAVSERLDEPLADSSLLPTYLVCRAARQSMTVALGGDGADEVFAGYPNFQAQLAAPMMRHVPAAVGAIARRGLALAPASREYMNLRFRLGQLTQGFGHNEDLQSFLWMAPFSADEKQALWRADALPEDPVAATFAPIYALARRGLPEERLPRLLQLFLQTYLPEDILVKTDRAAMMNSLEVRAPFLARDFAEFAIALPGHWKLRGLRGKYLLKKLAARLVPPDTVYRPKHGFALPLADLLRTLFFETMRGRLLDRGNPVAAWFNAPVIEMLLDEHRSGRRDHAKRLWTLYILFCVAARPG
ncbi:MAG TPA: asparagine synthase (glutamine-hydrolyzing) [Stellaceae bacterium]|nr:asparagine synthase (glutamine-hydrolyzing) [Stellaceae bacterium]